MPLPETIRWTAEGVRTLDQSRLPAEECHELHRTVESLADAISTLRIRGAPLLGVAGAMGVALAGREARGERREAVWSARAAQRAPFSFSLSASLWM